MDDQCVMSKTVSRRAPDGELVVVVSTYDVHRSFLYSGTGSADSKSGLREQSSNPKVAVQDSRITISKLVSVTRESVCGRERDPSQPATNSRDTMHIRPVL